MNELKAVLDIYIKKASTLIGKHNELCRKQEQLKQEQVLLEKMEKDLIQELEDVGLQSLHLMDGTSLSIVESYHCTINKNVSDMDNVCSWLVDQGQEGMVSSSLEVSPMYKDQLEGIPYMEHQTVNTSKVKAFIKEGLGLTGQRQQFEFKDLPKGLHFFINKEVKVE